MILTDAFWSQVVQDGMNRAAVRLKSVVRAADTSVMNIDVIDWDAVEPNPGAGKHPAHWSHSAWPGDKH